MYAERCMNQRIPIAFFFFVNLEFFSNGCNYPVNVSKKNESSIREVLSPQHFADVLGGR